MHCLLIPQDSPIYPEYKLSMTCFEHGSCSSGPRRRVGPSTGLSNHEHFMNWKDRKPFEERAAPWAGLKTWPAIAVDQDTASRTKRGEPNLWTHFGKRVRMLACSIRCFEHLVVSNRSGLLGSTKLCGVTMERSWASFMNVVHSLWDIDITILTCCHFGRT